MFLLGCPTGRISDRAEGQKFYTPNIMCLFFALNMLRHTTWKGTRKVICDTSTAWYKIRPPPKKHSISLENEHDKFFLQCKYKIVPKDRKNRSRLNFSSSRLKISISVEIFNLDPRTPPSTSLENFNPTGQSWDCFQSLGPWGGGGGVVRAQFRVRLVPSCNSA